MTVQVVDSHPVVAAIGSAVTTGGVAFGDGKKPANVGSKPYVVAFFDAGTVTDRSLASRDGWELYCSFQCAGLSPEAVRIAIRKVRAAVLGLRRQVLGGRLILMPTHEYGAPMSREDDADPTLFIQIDEWRIRTSPA